MAGVEVSRGVGRAWLILCVTFVIALVWHHMTMRGDSFWCLAGGDWVLSRGALPERDPFAFTSSDAPFVLSMPAFQIGGAWLVGHAGLRALMLACTLATAAGLVLVWLVSARSLAARSVSFALVVFAVELDAEDISARGQSFGDLGFALLLLLLFRLRNGGRVRWWCFALLGACWVNFHPSFVIAVLLPLGFVAALLLEPRAARAPLLPFVAASVLAATGAFLSPQPIPLVVADLKLLVDPTTSHIDLFNSPDFHRILWALAPASGIALAALRASRGDREGRASDAALLCAFVGATCLARRYGTLLVALEIAIAGRLLDRELPPIGRRLRVPLAIVAAALAAGTMAFAFEKKEPLALVPARAVEAVDRLRAPDRVISPYYWGGYLEWAWGGRRKVFIDGRNGYFANGTFDDAERLEQLAGWSDVLDAYEARTVLWVRGSPLDEALATDSRWAIAYRDAMAVVYVRR
jgi:hypothetical protein